MAETKAKYREADQKFLDSLNGMVCSTLASINGVKDAKPVDFMITRREPEKIEEDPMQKVKRTYQQFHAWATLTGGT